MKAFVALALLAACAVADYSSSDKVVILTEDNFKEQVLESDELWLVEFYAPWCGHCKNLEPEWKKAAKKAPEGAHFGAVDATIHSSLGSKYGVQGYPTIKVFGKDKKKPKDYKGGRTAKDLIQGAESALKAMGLGGGGSSSGGGDDDHDSLYGKDVVIVNEDNFASTIAQGKLTLVKFYAPWCGHCKNMIPAWTAAASQLKGEAVVIAALDATVETALAQKYEVKGFPTIKVFLPGEDAPVDYDGGRTEDAIVQYVNDKLAESTKVAVEQLTSPEVFEGCTSKRICVIAALPHLIDGGAAKRNSYLDLLKDLAGRHRKGYGFIWYGAGEQSGLDAAMATSIYPSLTALSFTKGRFSRHVHAFDANHLASFLSKPPPSVALSVAAPKIRTVEAWDGKDYTPPVETDEY